MSDLINRQEAITVMELHMRAAEEPYQRAMNYAFDVAVSCLLNLPSAESKTGKWVTGRLLYQSGYQQGLKDGQPRWIPIRWHDITDEEREREGYPKEWVVHIDCDMPNNGDEILVQTKSGYIRWDVCYEDGEFSLDSGLGWIDDIVAWMPLPEPWEGEDE